VQSVDWSLTTECTPPDQETSERRPYAPQGVTGGKLKLRSSEYDVKCVMNSSGSRCSPGVVLFKHSSKLVGAIKISFQEIRLDCLII
jgi:hypothetical protein